MAGWSVILTSDRGSFTRFGPSSVLGYVACMPARLVPRFFMDRFFTPPIKDVDKEGRALYAPYALRKIEASLVSSGITDVGIVQPERLEKAVSHNTKIVGISVHDPRGLDPVTFKLALLFGGGKSWLEQFFDELGDKISRLKRKYNFKVIAGGPGAWELARDRPEWLDVLLLGEAEVTLPPLVKSMLRGESVPPLVKGRDPKVEEIPPILGPTRWGEVQVTRGCPRGCSFCSITPETFRTIPLDTIKKEVDVNLQGGIRNIDLITDDILLYGSSKLRVNHEAIVKLFTEVKGMGVDGIFWPHISAPAVKSSPRTVQAMADIAGYDFDRSVMPVVGLESGSLKILEKYMPAKAFPWTPREWGDVIMDATAIMNDNYIFPCYTMTIGYKEETDDDVQESIDLVQKIIDHDFTAWIFPLPVIPISTTRIKDNPFPALEKLPSKYWDLLYIAWTYNMKVTRKLAPRLAGGKGVTGRIVRFMIDRIFSSIEWFFRDLKESKGKKSLEFSTININNTVGTIRAILELGRLSFKGHES
ncbi:MULTISPECIES: radical SAM protein [Metallosphaera]|uniref:B12-binding domain-containing radical SAM protein n=1 Tax=Metallosphaera TaxID=41980 RepID=UPI001F06E7B6|nr:radical SAM protein [Metallosphaera sedula]MCH1770340.1 B12-binding domain-containing radical SAM protein [Metallosphaera sedula]MCP6727826.1 B12-binding domain-containing radical SAM protein [Metallosphaera sedula]